MNKNSKFHFVTMDSLNEEEQEKEEQTKKVIPEEPAVEEETAPVEEPKEESDTPETTPAEKEEENKEEVKEEKPIEETAPIKKVYFSYKTRLYIYSIAIFVLMTIAMLLIFKVSRDHKSEFVKYIENSSITYEVCSKGTDDTNKSCSKEGERYSSSTTKMIPATFDYHISFEDKIEYDLSYVIKATLKVFDKNDLNSILEKQEKTYFESRETLSEDNQLSIRESFEIDYSDFASIMRIYKNRYADKNLTADIEVVLTVEDKEGSKKISSLTIPMTETTFKITKNNVGNNEGSMKITDEFWTTPTIIDVSIIAVLVIFSLIIAYEMVDFIQKTTSKKDDYNKKLLKLLREYDRIIVIARDGYESNIEREVIKVDSFEDLLKERQELQKPIIYSRVNSVKSEFIVEGEDKLYKYIMKEADI